MPGLSSSVSGSQSYRSTSKCLMQGLADSSAGRSLSQCQMPLNSQRGLRTCFTHLVPDFGRHLWSDSVATSLLALSLFSVHTIEGTRWPCGTVPDLRPRGRGFESRPWLLCTNANSACHSSLWGRLMSTSESWGVNGHTTRCTSPVSVVLRLWLVSG